MPFVPVQNVMSVDFVCDYLAHRGECSIYIHSASSVTLQKCTDLALRATDWWQDEIMPSLSDQLDFVAVKVADLTDQFSFVYENVLTTPVAGGQTGATLPSNIAACVSFRTGLRGRSYRGRNYLWGLTEPLVTDNVIQEGWRNGVIGAYQQIDTDVCDTDQAHVVVSRFQLGNPLVNGIATDVINYVMDSRVDTQRRRLKVS